MRAWTRAGLAALAVWILAASSPATAGTLEISFAVDQGQLAFGVPGSFSNQVTTFTGSGRVVLTGVDSLGMLTTPSATGSLSGLRLDFNGPPPGVGGDIEPQAFTQVFVATGTFDGTSLMLPPVTLAVSFSRPGFQGIPAFNLSSVGLPILSLDTPGAAELLIGVTFQVPNNPGLIRFDVRGRELARTFAAPELSSLECLFVGLLALVARAAWRGRAVPRALS